MPKADGRGRRQGRRSAPSGLRAKALAALVSWLEAERAALAAAWTKTGISSTVTVDRLLGYLDVQMGPSAKRPGRREMVASVRSETKVAEVSRLDLMAGLPVRCALSTTPPVDALVAAYGEHFVDGVLANGQDDSLGGRFSPFFEHLSGDYLQKLPTISSGDREMAGAVAQGYLDFVETDELTEVELLPIAGVAPVLELVEAGDAALRPLSPEERGDVLRRAMNPKWFEGPMAFPAVLQFRTETAAAQMYAAFLTVRSRQPKGRRSPRVVHRLARVVLALQLKDYDIMGEGLAASWTEPGPRVMVRGPDVAMPLFTPGPGSRFLASLGRADLKGALELAERIPPACFDKPSQRGEIALHRFSMATSQQEEAEALIDYVIALEALLVPGGSTAETTLRFCLNGARFLAVDAAERPVVYQDLKRVYKARSTLVHGSRTKKLGDLEELRGKARTLASRGLLKALRTHWPTEKELESAVLS